jgi:signal transduction histidine kinase
VEGLQAAASKIGVRLVNASDLPSVQVMVNEPAIQRLLHILLDNALKHTPAGGRITLTATPSEAGVEVQLEDTGEGIAPEALPHIFEPFFRGDSSRTANGSTGLGLSIAKAIVEAHGTTIEVDSEPGRGARFRFLLPAS